ncbi:MAG TPA: hypothetical protein VHX65_20495 [Pirellulales bacterium]|nr:hypothetical protein [Pirellulales bacterium]
MNRLNPVFLPDPTVNVLKDLEHRHNDVLEQLDDLNRRVEQALADARRQFQAEGVADLAAARAE